VSLDINLAVRVDVGNPDVTSVSIGESFNITHNVASMWRKAGCYDALYSSGGKTAADILPMLRAALAKMQDEPAVYRKLNPSNGWGDYDGAVRWLTDVIAEFSKYPKATVEVSA
jgi:hypothetical protein